jgi:hypothetical protein
VDHPWLLAVEDGDRWVLWRLDGLLLLSQQLRIRKKDPGRSQEYAARNQGQEFERLRYATEETVEFSPIPCWAHLPPEVYRARIKSLVDSVIADAALERSRTGRPVEGVESILTRDPQHRPAKLARSPAPLVHAATKAARKAFYEMYAWFVATFRSAAEKLKQEDREARFPAGSFPPGLPFIAG